MINCCTSAGEVFATGGDTSPADGFQHFGEVRIDGRTGAFRVDLRDRDGVSLWSTTLPKPRNK